MNSKIALTIVSLLFTSVVLTSNTTGPVQAGNGNRTGSKGTAAGCFGDNCHGFNNNHTTVNIEVQDDTGTVSEYIPGKKYTVIMTGVNQATPAHTKFGLQVSSVFISNTSQQAGSFSASQFGTKSLAIRVDSGIQVVETVSAVAGGFSPPNTYAYINQIDWTAPPKNSGPVRFYYVLLACNGDGTENYDQANVKTIQLGEGVGIDDVAHKLKLNLYPNPVSNQLNIDASDMPVGDYTLQVVNTTGKALSMQQLTPVQRKATINTSNWASGMYFVTVTNTERVQKTYTVIKS